MKMIDALKPLLRFDCFFATIALILIFAYFFAVTFWLPGEANDISKIILGALVIVFQQIANWAWRTTKAATDKRLEQKECVDVPPANS